MGLSFFTSLFLSTLYLTLSVRYCFSIPILLYDTRSVRLIQKVDKNFLSFQIDSNQLVHHWRTVNLSEGRLINLTKALIPAYIRVGGTDGDRIVFCPNKKTPEDPPECQKDNDVLSTEISGEDFRNNSIDMKTISENDIRVLGKFVEETQAKLVYGLNVLQRKGSVWDAKNSLQLINFMNTCGISVTGWELGNEPRHFKKVFNTRVTGRQLSHDFGKLKTLLSRIPRYAKTEILGPDITHIGKRKSSRSIKMLRHFLGNLKNDTISAVTFHDYYFAGDNSSVQDYLNAEIMDTLKRRINLVRKTVKSIKPNLPLWIGETSSAWGGGTHNISDRFVSTFTWLDKLGQSSLLGVKVVIRQVLMNPLNSHISYGLLTNEMNPTPDYFVSYIFKKLVGNKVLSNRFIQLDENTDGTEGSHTKPSNKIRFYVHCAFPSNSKLFSEDAMHKDSIFSAEDGAIVLFGINVDDITYGIRLLSTENQIIEEYLLTSFESDLTSPFCDLNGEKLHVGLDGIPLPLRPKVLRQNTFYVLPKSLGFWVARNANVSFCKKSYFTSN